MTELFLIANLPISCPKKEENITKIWFKLKINDVLEECIVFEGINCINELLNHASNFKGEFKQVDEIIHDYN